MDGAKTSRIKTAAKACVGPLVGLAIGGWALMALYRMVQL